MATTLSAGDWPQILGPYRNGLATKNESIADGWGRDGPPVNWTLKVGEGLAGPAVAGGTVYMFHREGSSEVLQASDLSSGDDSLGD